MRAWAPSDEWSWIDSKLIRAQVALRLRQTSLSAGPFLVSFGVTGGFAHAAFSAVRASFFWQHGELALPEGPERIFTKEEPFEPDQGSMRVVGVVEGNFRLPAHPFGAPKSRK